MADGTVVFSDTDEVAHVGVPWLDDDSVRIQTVLESEASPSTFTYSPDA